ncbi:MAG: oxidoreductase [Renibacterium salmoninarum]|nr:oxidoreductase [Renibacterium salmoninarum]
MRSWLDTQLGRFTMYRLVLVALAVLAGYAAVLDLLGWISFGIAAIGLSLVVSLSVTVAVSWLTAKLFRAHTHLESSLITGLLLFFLFTPSTSARPLTVLAIAAAIAGASKFLFAVRGRHLFNPAAIGALLVSFLGPGLVSTERASWWVATPAMLWLVLPAILLVLFRTSKLVFAGIFLLVSSSIIVARLLGSGFYEPAAAFALPFTSYPGLFLVGFMLSEPLTLPPRRWQQWGLAGIVAVLFSVPFALPPVYSSPELALVVGNLIAFALGQRRGLRLTYLGAKALTPSSKEFSFTLPLPARFKAGQYMELSLPHRGSDGRGIRRVFSLTSDPHDGGKVAFGLRLSEPSSSFKRELNSLSPGTVVSATGVWGDFVLPRGHAPLLFLAAGVGITPFMSHLRSVQKHSSETRDVVLVYTVNSVEEFGYRDELARLCAAEGVRLVPFCPDDPQLGEHLGSGYPEAEVLKRAVPDIASRRVYASGSPAFVAHAVAHGHRAGARKVHTDSFLGY